MTGPCFLASNYIIRALSYFEFLGKSTCRKCSSWCQARRKRSVHTELLLIAKPCTEFRSCWPVLYLSIKPHGRLLEKVRGEGRQSEAVFVWGQKQWSKILQAQPNPRMGEDGWGEQLKWKLSVPLHATGPRSSQTQNFALNSSLPGVHRVGGIQGA